ncbi:anti-sigma factor family protein [Streptomyces sp. NPDC050145]|uniref:anti-sigma factor family protein n=1 Tax=Streptomyces sp. NPDC050145 TaxID=3365602 RepID=UPI00378C70B9
MTSTTGTAEHPEVTEISDLTEGLLPPSRTTEIRRHLDGCPLCADVYTSLQEIRGMLGTLPGPPRMPEDIAGRIDAALAAEAFLDTLAPGDDQHAGRDGLEEPVRETVGVSRETTPDTARSADRPTGHARSTSTGPGRKTRRVRRRTTAAIGAVLTVAAIGMGTLLLQSGGGGGPTTAHKSPAATEAPAPGTLAAGTLGNKVTELLDRKAQDRSLSTQDSGPKTPRSDSPIPKLASDDVPPCVQRGTHRTEAPLASEQGTYQGKKAYLVVLPHKTDPEHRVTAFVVDASCAEKSSATPGELLYTHSYDRG